MSEIGELINKALKQAEIAVEKADEAVAAAKEAGRLLKEIIPKDEEEKETKQ